LKKVLANSQKGRTFAIRFHEKEGLDEGFDTEAESSLKV